MVTKKITTTGYWSNGLWVSSGGASQEITLMQSALADNLHPHSDLSGKAIIKYANVLYPFMRNLR